MCPILYVLNHSKALLEVDSSAEWEGMILSQHLVTRPRWMRFQYLVPSLTWPLCSVISPTKHSEPKHIIMGNSIHTVQHASTLTTGDQETFLNPLFQYMWFFQQQGIHGVERNIRATSVGICWAQMFFL